MLSPASDQHSMNNDDVDLTDVQQDYGRHIYGCQGVAKVT